MSELIKRLIKIKHSEPALRTGKEGGSLTNLVTTAEDNVYAYRRTAGDENVVVMLNFSENPISFVIPNGLPQGIYTDALGTMEADFSAKPTFSLPAYGAAVFVKK